MWIIVATDFVPKLKFNCYTMYHKPVYALTVEEIEPN